MARRYVSLQVCNCNLPIFFVSFTLVLKILSAPSFFCSRSIGLLAIVGVKVGVKMDTFEWLELVEERASAEFAKLHVVPVLH